MVLSAITFFLLTSMVESQSDVVTPTYMPHGSISTKVIDTSFGHPAEGVPVLVYIEQDDWKFVSSGQDVYLSVTESSGMVACWSPDISLQQATYKLRFMTGVYFSKLLVNTLYPYTEVVFSVANDSQHYHIPLALSPYGYSTYRGF